jgi:choline dehydrogenase
MAERRRTVVVGLGVAGSIVAAALSEDPLHEVLAIEAGPEFPSCEEPGREIAHVPSLGPLLWGGDLDWRFSTTPQVALEGRSVDWPRGKVIGGSSGINVAAWVRGHPDDYDAWRRFGSRWSWSTALEAFRAIEDSEAGEAPWRGVGGPLPVTRTLGPTSPARDAIHAAAAALGWPPTDVNGPHLEGVDVGSRTSRAGLRVTFADAFLSPARHRPNLTVVPEAHVVRIRFRGDRANGVAYRVGGDDVEADADEVVLAAGAVGTPHLLQLSGVGPAEVLERVGVPLVADVPGVGANLHDHPAVWTGVFHADPTARGPDPADVVAAARQVLDGQAGPLASSSGSIAFVRSAPDVATPDLEFILTDTVTAPDGRRVPGVGVAWVLLQPRSRGTIRLASADPFAHPLIDPGYLTDPAGHDLRTLHRGFRIARQLLDRPELANLTGAPVDPSFRSDATDAEVEQFLRRTTATIYHPVGSARFGTDDDPLAALDDELRVRGVSGVRVVDSSAIPEIVRGHTAAATAVIAHTAAALLTSHQARADAVLSAR